MAQTPIDPPIRNDPTLAATVDIGRIALWNYVTLLVWLRWLRRGRIFFNVVPVLLGGFGSWKILVDANESGVAFFAATLALLAGLLPLLYLASGIEDNLAFGSRMAAGYRVLEARARDLVIRFWALPSAKREELYQRIHDEHMQLRGTVLGPPRWAFDTAEKLIARGDYAPIAAVDAVEVRPEQF